MRAGDVSYPTQQSGLTDARYCPVYRYIALVWNPAIYERMFSQLTTGLHGLKL